MMKTAQKQDILQIAEGHLHNLAVNQDTALVH